MASKKTIKKIALIAVWAAICGGLFTLLLAANGRKKDLVCRDVSVFIRGTGENYFIGKSDISGMLRHGHKRSLKGELVQNIDLARLEQELETNAWIQDAELYFDSQNTLHVTVTERQPVARVFTAAGSSFYMDTAGVRLPLLPNISARVPVVTNFPAAKKLNQSDSAVLLDVKSLVQYITGDPFWNAQIAQIDVQPDRTYELLPVVGNHTIRIGKAEQVDKKLRRLLLLYQQVLSKTGFDRYSIIDVQYEGQVVATNEGEESEVDAEQLQKNIDALLQADQMMAAHKEATFVEEKKQEKPGPAGSAGDQAAEKAETKAKPEVPEKANVNKERKPKALMPKRQ